MVGCGIKVCVVKCNLRSLCGKLQFIHNKFSCKTKELILLFSTIISVSERCHITDFRYHYDEAKIVKTEPLSLGKVVVANQCLKSMVKYNILV